MADRSDRVYEAVLREGTDDDILADLNGTLLVDLWSEWSSPAICAPDGPQSSTEPWPISDRRRPSHPDDELSVEVAAVFFQLPASHGLLLAGRTALAAQHLTIRPTQDFDFSTNPGRGEVPAVRYEFVTAAPARRYQMQLLRNEITFCRQ